MVVPVAYGEEVGEIPTDAWYADGSSWGKPRTETEVAFRPTLTPSGWKQERTTAAGGLSSEPWVLTLCTDS